MYMYSIRSLLVRARSLFSPSRIVCISSAIALSSLVVAQPGIAQTHNSTLIGAWSFDEGIGVNVADRSNEQGDGTVFGHTWAPGKRANGICFAGANGQHMTTASGAVKNPTSVTLSGWIKPNASQQAWGWIAGFGDSLGLYVDADGGLVMYIWTGSEWKSLRRSQSQLGLGAAGLKDGAWHHVAGSYDPASGIALHVDGDSIGTASPAGPISYSQGGDFRIGSMQGLRTFNGCLDEIQLHAKVLTTTELQSSANTIVQAETATPVDDASNNACVDYDGDGWGWDGTDSCIVTVTHATSTPTENTVTSDACVDSDGDGWGWDGTDSCLASGAASGTATANSCIDTDGDGWGWDGTGSCIATLNSTSASSNDCIDEDGDGWGWDGTDSCLVQQTETTQPQETPMETEPTNVVVDSVNELALTWGNSPMLADIHNNRLFLSLGEEFATRRTLSSSFNYRYSASGYTVNVDGQQVAAGSQLSLAVQHGDVISLTISHGNSVFGQFDLIITNLPLIEIFAGNIVDEPKLPGTIRWVDGTRGIDTGTMQLGIEIRGNTAQRFDKKAYSIEVRDEDGDGTNVQFLDLRKDDDWILDAAYRDQSFVRNLVSHDIYRDMRSYAYINSEGEEKGQSTLAGGLAEVILNSRYHGVYVIHEKVDRKLLKLAKVDVPEDASGDRWDLVDFDNPDNGSVLYKASRERADFHSTVGLESQYEQKYPKDDDISHYQPLRELVDFIANSSDGDFNNRVAGLIEYESVVDWWLLRLVSSNWDAFHKNYYPARSETLKWTIVPWDFDATFGMDWRGGVDAESVEFYDPERNNLVGRLTASPQNGFNTMAKARWKTLRRSLFRADSIAARFAYYSEQVDRGLNVSGVSPRQRNLQRWPNTGNTGAGIPELADVEAIRAWMKKRLSFVDRKMNELPE